MRLRVPGGQMQHVFSTLWFWFVEVRIRLCERAEQFAMPAFEVQTKGSVEGVAGFVPQDAHAFGVSAAFHLQHLLPFELHQARMGEVKRNRDAGHAVWRKPLLRQPNMGFEADSAGIELVVKAFYVRFEKRPLDFYRKVADAQIKQLLIAETMPRESVAHGGPIIATKRHRSILCVLWPNSADGRPSSETKTGIAFRSGTRRRADCALCRSCARD